MSKIKETEIDMMEDRAKGYTAEHTDMWLNTKKSKKNEAITYIEEHYPETAKEFQRL